ncbi:MAG: PAS domain S-box protein [Burkholderiales bacterium]|nr:PAS domain S-box protein [Burkholderiales bacterium]
MSRTKSSASLQQKLLAPFFAAMLLFALGLHFIWLPSRLDDARHEFRRTQESMLAVLTPALTGLLLSEDLVQVHATLTQTAKDFTQWVDIALYDPQGRRLFPVENRDESEAEHLIWLEVALRYQDTALGRLRVATDPTGVLQAEARKIWELEASLLVMVMLTVGLFLWLQNRLIVRPLRQLAEVANRLAQDDFAAVLPTPKDDEVGYLIRAFDAMRSRRQSTESALVQANERSKAAQELAEGARNLLHEAVSNVAQGFTIYDQQDRLVLCNEAYLNMYEASRDLIVPGATFEEIVRKGAERGQYLEALGRVDEWVKGRVEQHQNAHGEVLQQELGDGRWLMIIEYRTPSGYIVGNRVEITNLKRTTTQLRQRILYQRATLDNLPFQFWLKDTEGRFLAVNKVFANSYGYSDPEQITGLTDFDICPLEKAQRYRSNDQEVMDSRKDLLLEESRIGSQGPRWSEVFKKPVIGDDGVLLGTVGFARDITERKQMTRALAASEQRWSLAVTGSNDGIWDWDTQAETVYFSDRWKSMLGYEVEELSNDFEEWSTRIHPEDRERVIADLQRHLEGLSQHYQSEYRLRCKDTSYKWVYDRGQALFNETGKPIRMAGSLADISERKATQAQILDRTEQLNAIFLLSPDGFVSFDRALKVKSVSPAFLRMTGLVESELIGLDEAAFSQRLSQMCPPTASFPTIAALRASSKFQLNDDDSAQGEASGKRHLFELTASHRMLEVQLRLSNAETVSQILYFRDITHEVEVDRIKTEFLATAAHELRTPMSSIFGFAELLMSFDFSAEERMEYIQIIHRQSGLMVTILNELLDLARIEDRRGKDFNLSDIELGHLLADVIDGYKAPAGRAVSLQVGAEGALRIRADRGKLIQAVSNVLSNAYKYSPQGGAVELTLINQSAQTDDPRIGICIRDHGIGMTPEQLARVFERFYRADTSGKIPGTGLGMSIVKEIIELHGGKIDITSRPGEGTMVTLWMPVTP